MSAYFAIYLALCRFTDVTKFASHNSTIVLFEVWWAIVYSDQIHSTINKGIYYFFMFFSVVL